MLPEILRDRQGLQISRMAGGGSDYRDVVIVLKRLLG
jgi:hypothetical protein